MKQCRTHLNLSLAGMAERGGPSVTTQHRTESGEGVLTDETLGKYMAALQWRVPGSVCGRGGWLEAIAHVHAAAERGGPIAAAGAGQTPEGPLRLGITVDGTAQVIAGNALYAANMYEKDRRRGDAAINELAQESDWLAINRLLLHRALDERMVCIYDNGETERITERAESDPRYRVVHGIENHIDPIAGVTTLEQARDRVQLLTRGPSHTGPDVEAVAWLILLANVVGAQRNISPYVAWSRRAEYEQQWEAAYNQATVSVRKSLPGQSMWDAGKPVLMTWTGIDPDLPTGVGFTVTDTGVQWHSNPDWELREPMTATARDLWFYQGRNKNVGTILHGLGIPNITCGVQGVQVSGHHRGGVWMWCPVPTESENIYAIACRLDISADWPVSPSSSGEWFALQVD